MSGVLVKVSWKSALPWILTVLENGTTKGKLMAREELARMAEAADMAVKAKEEGKL